MFINLFPLDRMKIKGWLDIIKVVYLLHLELEYYYITIALNSLLLANVSSLIVTVPVIPVPHSKPKDVLVLEEGETVLAVPVIGLVPHPVEPRIVSCLSWKKVTRTTYHSTSVLVESHLQSPQLCSL